MKTADKLTQLVHKNPTARKIVADAGLAIRNMKVVCEVEALNDSVHAAPDPSSD